MLVLAMLPAATSAVRLEERQAVPASADPTCSPGGLAGVPGYDPVTHEMYVPNEYTVIVYKGTCTLVGSVTLPTGAEPISAVFDPVTNDMYVLDPGLNQIYQISGTTILYTYTTSEVPSLDSPYQAVFDPINDCLWITDNSGNTVTVFYSGAGGYYSSGWIPVGSAPSGIAFDPHDEAVVVANYGSNNVTYLDASTGADLGDFAVGADPNAVGYDPADALEYVANEGSNTVTILDEGAVVDTILFPGFDLPSGMVWSQAKLGMYVTSYGDGKVWFISGESLGAGLSTAVGAYYAAYDEFNDMIYVTNNINGKVYVLA